VSETLNRNVVLDPGAVSGVVLEDSLISVVGPELTLPHPDAGVIDASGRLLEPAFVDAHTHMDKSLLSRD